MHAEGLRWQWKPRASHRLHALLASDLQRLRNGHAKLRDHRSRLAAGNEIAIFRVAAVDETLRANLQAGPAGGGGKHSTRRCVNRATGQHRCHSRGHRRRQFRITSGLVVKRTMRLDVVDSRPRPGRNLRKTSELARHQLCHVGRCKRHRPPAEILVVLITGMRANRHARRKAGIDGRAHRRLITGMAAAGNVRGVHQIDQRSILRSAFAEVGIEIDHAHGFESISSSPACKRPISRFASSQAARASSSETLRNRSRVPGKARASFGTSAEMTCPICG